MAWTPFGKSTTSTPAHQPQTYQPDPQHHDQQPQSSGQDQNWFSNFEGQLAVDVYQTATDIVIRAPIAGVQPADIDIAITDDVVTVKGERKPDQQIAREDYYCQECYYGTFSRSIILPVAVATDQAEATFVNGVLTVMIPKAEKAMTRKVAIKAV
jgi:HSP20 family protein